MQSIKISAMKQPQVGELIRSLRHELNLTQQQLSVELGVVRGMATIRKFYSHIPLKALL
ncbi:hypothetical protein [Pleurocapsa sp. CCALA 161]|uniref:hypothetical protein n=1 Tax=Pleurocapsa sp. CCALA 161 TaxID=2107688 RepID=UPI001304CBFE|nr:hypothetical protein [Pleurocapsa sp. CCALA 161]